MARFLAALLFACWFLAPVSVAQSHHTSGTHSSKPHTSKSTKPKKTKPPKTEGTFHVNGYYRKDGTYVAPHDRSAPSSKGTGTTTVEPSYKKNYVAPSLRADPTVKRDKDGRIKRSSAAKGAFKREHPCPSTGKTSGSCKGYVVDHIKPLECGGADAPSNMQWQTTAEGKAKDKTERSCRQ